MLTPNLRALRLALLATLFASVFSFANTASAQWGDPVCGDPNTINGVFSGFTFTGLDKCVADCKQIGALCKSLVRESASCNQTSSKGYWDFMDNTNCDTLAAPADRKSCHAEVAGIKSDSRKTILSDRDAALQTCQDETDTCVMSCSPPL